MLSSKSAHKVKLGARSNPDDLNDLARHKLVSESIEAATVVHVLRRRHVRLSNGTPRLVPCDENYPPKPPTLVLPALTPHLVKTASDGLCIHPSSLKCPHIAASSTTPKYTSDLAFKSPAASMKSSISSSSIPPASEKKPTTLNSRDEMPRGTSYRSNVS